MPPEETESSRHALPWGLLFCGQESMGLLSQSLALIQQLYVRDEWNLSFFSLYGAAQSDNPENQGDHRKNKTDYGNEEACHARQMDHQGLIDMKAKVVIFQISLDQCDGKADLGKVADDGKLF